MPDKYDQFSLDDFQALVDKQKSITKSTYLVLQDFDDYIDNIADAIENSENPSQNEECTDLFEDVINGLKRISKLIEDDGFKSILSEIDIDSGTMELRKYRDDSNMTQDQLINILIGSASTTPVSKKITLNERKLHKFFPAYYSKTEMERVIFGLLEQWKQAQESEEK